MPIYAYKCGECGHEMEAIRKVSDALLTDCPKCGKPALVKQITAAGFHLKGAGWYVTDFRDSGSGKKKDSVKTDEGAKTDQASRSESDGKAEVKPETKTDIASDSKSAAKIEPKTESKSDSKSQSKSESGSKPAPAPTGSAPPKSDISSGTD